MKGITLICRFYYIIFTLLLFILHKQSIANAAQPGIWNAGGTVFTMLYPEDSLTFKKVQMQEEKIYIQLYKGYAVIKGIYIFKNTTKEQLSFKMGYPVNGIYYGGDSELNEIYLDSLSRFKIKTQGNWLSLIKQPNKEYGSIQSFSDNWMVWPMAFAPNETQEVEVYFIVNTNNAQIRKGYNINNYNAFIYLIESGSVWKQPIEKGDFYVQLMDGINQTDIKGLSSGFSFGYNEPNKVYAGAKTKFEPSQEDNLIITYSERSKTFDFETLTSLSEQLFNRVDSLSKIPLQNLEYTTIKAKNPYHVSSSISGFLPGLLMLFIIYAPLIIGAIILLIAVWAGIKWMKVKNKSL